jgi:anti-sigma B factor antagonist
VERGASGKLEIMVSYANGARVVRLKGEFDLAGVPAFEAELDRDPGPHEGTVVLDMSHVTFLDSSGLRAVLMADRKVRADGRRCIVVRGPERVARVLELTGVDDRLELVDSFPVPERPS